MAAEPTTFHRVAPTPAATAPRLAAEPPPAPAAPGWSLHRALVLAGFGAVLAAVAVFTRLDPARLASPEMAFALPGALAAALLAARETPRRLLAGGLAVSLLPLVVLLGFGGLAELAKPASGASYQSVALLTLALALALPAGARGWRRAKQGRPAVPLAGSLATRHGAFAFGASAALLASALAGALATEQGQAGGSGGAYDLEPDARVALSAQGFDFVPAEVRLRAGALTEVVVTNRDGAAHTFTYAAGGNAYHHDVPGLGEARFLVRLDDPGTLAYWCAPHSGGPEGARKGMVGTLLVEGPGPPAGRAGE